jgi:hypothetical protein
MSFWLTSWLKNREANSLGTWRNKPRSAARPIRSTRLFLEYLEDRLAPAGIVVTTPSDLVLHSGVSLRDAIATANTDAAAGQSDTISFDQSLNGATITLSQGQLQLTIGSGTTTIDGAGRVAISGHNASRVFLVQAGAQAVLNRLTIENGNSFINEIGNGANGGGISNDRGTLTVTNSTLSGNSAINLGGGIYDHGGILTVSNCNLTGNSAGDGGGVFADGGLTVSNSIFVGNSVTSSGGGIYSSSVATVSNTTFSAISALGYGAGIFTAGMTVSNSTFSGNSLAAGTAIFNLGGTTTVTNSTVSSNSGDAGGGIFNDQGTVVVTNSTLSGNSPGGIYNIRGTTMLNDTIVANNTGGDLYVVLGPSIFTGSYDLIGDGSYLSSFTHSLQGNPVLAPLANNGGPTQTMALLPGSPAIDAGNNALAVDAQGQPLQFDQRGPGFPRIVGAAVDIGAFEVQLVTPTVTLTAANAAYTGLPYDTAHLTTTVTPPTATGSVSYVFYSDATGNTTIADPINAGTYYVQAIFTSSDPTRYTNARSAIVSFAITPKALTVEARTQGTINIAKEGTISFDLRITAGLVANNNNVAALFNGATFTIAVGGTSYSLTATAAVVGDDKIKVSIRMNPDLRNALLTALSHGDIVDFRLTALSNDGDYSITADATSRLINEGN